MSDSALVQLSVESVRDDIDAISAIIDRALTEANQARIFGDEIMPFFTRSPQGGRPVPRTAVIKLALLCDCVHVADMALHADDQVTAQELEFVEPLLFMAARFYGRLRREYAPFAELYDGSAAEFLGFHRQDSGLFGRACQATHWIGLGLCCRVARHTGDTEALHRYESMVIRLMDEVIAVGGISAAEARKRSRIQNIIQVQKEVQSKMADTTARVTQNEDPRIRGFCSERGPEVFSAIASAAQIWSPDPYDVDTIHREARTAFQRLIDRVTEPGASEQGRILLILGESGSGKTHLMRAFRNYLHHNQLGYAAYMQMSTRTASYAGYILSNLVTSLEQPYDLMRSEASGLAILSNAVAEAPMGMGAELERLRDDDFAAGTSIHDHLHHMVDQILLTDGFADFDPDVLRALLYLQRSDPPTRARVLKYLRGFELSDYDRRLLGGMSSRPAGDDALETLIQELGKLGFATQQGAQVLLIDQLEDIFDLDDAAERFRRLTTVVRHIVDHQPSTIVVIACLTDLYSALRPQLSGPILDRIERDPEPIHLTSRRTLDEIEAIIEKRLGGLYDALDIRRRDDDTLFPFRRKDLEALTNLRTRDVLDWCRRYHEACIAAGTLVELPGPIATVTPPRPEETDLIALEQEWNDFRSAFAHDVPEDDSALLEILAWAAAASAAELEPGYTVRTEREDELLVLHAPGPTGAMDTLLVGICNHGGQGGWLFKQLTRVKEHAGTRRPVVVRSSQFPGGPKSRTTVLLGELIKAGGRRVEATSTEWLAMLALRVFLEKHRSSPERVAAWQRTSRPLTQLKAMRDLLGLDGREPVKQTAASPMPVAAPAPAGGVQPEPEPQPDAERGRTFHGQPGSTSDSPGAAQRSPDTHVPAPLPGPTSTRKQPLLVGKARSVGGEPFYLDPAPLTRHAAFLGSSGSGKTTLALSLIEQLLERGIPAVLIDRKGDLATYAQPGWWSAIREPERRARAERFASLVDVRLYTPGNPTGRPLGIPVVPAGMSELPSYDRSKVALYAASALGAMMGYRDTGTDQTRIGILAKAIEILAQLHSAADVTLDQLIDFIHAEDPVLLSSIGKLDAKHFGKLVEHLTTQKLTRGELLATTGPLLDAAELLGRGEHAEPGKTRLSIISTKFLGETAGIEFWISRLLIEVRRWASKHPSPVLQAVMLFDEADIYLPATGKPATKEPMQDLLKRARSAGMGILLATQNPGDLDYRCRDNIGTWFVGKVSEKRSVDKMKPLLSEYQGSVEKKLATQGTGEFFLLHEGKVTQIRAERSLLDTRQLGDEELLHLARAQAHTP